MKVLKKNWFLILNLVKESYVNHRNLGIFQGCHCFNFQESDQLIGLVTNAAKEWNLWLPWYTYSSQTTTLPILLETNFYTYTLYHYTVHVDIKIHKYSVGSTNKRKLKW